jgi:hypothetical protein
LVSLASSFGKQGLPLENLYGVIGASLNSLWHVDVAFTSYYWFLLLMSISCGLCSVLFPILFTPVQYIGLGWDSYQFIVVKGIIIWRLSHWDRRDEENLLGIEHGGMLKSWTSKSFSDAIVSSDSIGSKA